VKREAYFVARRKNTGDRKQKTDERRVIRDTHCAIRDTNSAIRTTQHEQAFAFSLADFMGKMGREI